MVDEDITLDAECDSGFFILSGSKRLTKLMVVEDNHKADVEV